MAAGDRSTVSTIHTHGVFQTVIAATPTIILGVEQVGMDPKVKDMIGYAGGDYRPSFSTVDEIAPLFTFTCSDLVNSLTLIDHQDGKGISGGTDTAELYFAKETQVGTRAGGANNMEFSSKLALIYLEEISASQGQHATANFSVVTVYDTTNEPMIVTTGATLPTNAPLTQFFKLGKSLINAVNVPGIVGFSYHPNIEVEVIHAGGDHRPTFASIKRGNPKIQLRTLEVPSYNTYGITGTVGSGICTSYLYKYLKNSTVALDATAEHIKITTTAAFSRIHMGALSARNDEKAEGEIVITAVYDGTNKPFVFNLASAVS